jgi:hypothetical protein
MMGAEEVKVAVTDLELLMVTVHDMLAVSTPPSAAVAVTIGVQPVNPLTVEPAAGVAVRVTVVPLT